MRNRMKRSSALRGFTLVEILVVLAIVGVLSAVLLPVFFSSRAQARRAVCASNLSQIGKAMALYVSDHDGYYPSAITATFINNKSVDSDDMTWWREHLAPYMKSTFPMCPDVELTGAELRVSMKSTASGYALNHRLNRASNKSGPSYLIGSGEFRLRYPSQTVTVMDARAMIIALSRPDAFSSADLLDQKTTKHSNFKEDILSQTPGALRHGGGANYLFADGRVKWYRPEQISIARQNDGTTPGFGL